MILLGIRYIDLSFN